MSHAPATSRLPAAEREILLNYAVDGDPTQGAREVAVAAGLRLRERCRALIPARAEAMDLLGGADWPAMVERAALTVPTPALGEAHPEFAALAARHAAEAAAGLAAAQGEAAARRQEKEDALARRDAALTAKDFVTSRALRRRAAVRKALAGTIWIVEGLAVAAAALARSDGFQDYASLADVPRGTLLSEGAYGVGAALGYFALKALLVRAVRGYLATRSAVLAGLALAAGSATLAYAAALAALRAGEVPGAEGIGFLVSGPDGAKFALLFLGIPALALWAQRLADDAAELGRRADEARAEEDAWAARVAAAARDADAAEEHASRLALTAALAESLAAWFEADVAAYQTAAHVGSVQVEGRVLAFRSALAEVRAMGRSERVRWVEAERRRQRDVGEL